MTKSGFMLLAMSTLLATGCDAKKTASSTPAPSATAQEPSREQSRFFAEIDQEKVAEDKTRSDALTVRFDFSGKKICGFDYVQQVENVNHMRGTPGDGGGVKQKMDATGIMVLKSKGDKSGTLVIKDLKAKMVVASKKGEPDRTMEVQSPPMAIPEVKEDGSMEGGAANAQPFLKLLFPMPPTPLKPGESAEIPVTMPFNAMGSPLLVKGTMKITHKGYFTLDGKPCAKLEADIDVSRLDIPKEVEGKYTCSMKGRSIHYFDVEAKEFASGQTALLMKVAMEGKMPSFNVPKEKPVEAPKTIQMAMESDNLIRFTRNAAIAKKESEEK
jgi:hypothetical protein